MTLSVVIENGILAGSDCDDGTQRIATVYVDSDCYYVVAPAKLRGEALKFTGHFSVREPSKDALDFGGELVVTDRRKDAIVNAVADELRKRTRDSGRVVGRTPDGRYYDAQICLRGHVRSHAGTPFTSGDHCSKCGSACIDECSSCREPIRGRSVDTDWSGYDLPSYCHGCGRPYPWMEERLRTAKDLLDHDDKLTLDDRKRLWDLLQHVMSDPKSDLAPSKKKLIEIDLEKAKDATKDFIQGLLAKTIVEAARG
jgi:hypothetical protein